MPHFKPIGANRLREYPIALTSTKFPVELGDAEFPIEPRDLDLDLILNTTNPIDKNVHRQIDQPIHRPAEMKELFNITSQTLLNYHFALPK